MRKCKVVSGNVKGRDRYRCAGIWCASGSLQICHTMRSFSASLLQQEGWSEWWTGHNSLHTAHDHALYKFIDYLHTREQINLCWIMTTGQKQLDPRLNPMVKPFSPQNHQDATHKNRTEINTNETSTHNVSQETKIEDATLQKTSTGEINNNKNESATTALFNNTCTCENASCVPLLINKGKVFGKFKSVEKDRKLYANKHSVLDDEDASHCTNETGIVYGIAEKIATKEENDTLKQQSQEITNQYEIEKMTVCEIEEHLKHAKEIYDTVIKEGDNKISGLKDKKCKQRIKYHHAQKEIDNYKHQAKK